MDGNDADQVLGITDYDWCEPFAVLDCRAHPVDDPSLLLAELDRVGRILGEHDELSEVDCMRALAQQLALRPLLATCRQEPANIVKIAGLRITGERL